MPLGAISALTSTYFQFLKTMIPFESNFGSNLLFFPENSVPLRFINKNGVEQPVEMPYGTYNIARTDIFQSSLNQLRIWTRSQSIGQVLGLCEHIETAIPNEGRILSLLDNKGAIGVYRGDRFMQLQPMDEPDIKVMYINVEIRSYVL